ncbi:hypothetical protein CHS0354_018439 [Potamilus streckersoni]|uniref:Uncharacterized protein n=1 Tax=Potamilus streckersoni TaxID=2493646 RepID=A0AAE0TAJ7_9BIVA|nr:hypothetical protein CHS0354_018439 [Potamilus streckersoni]
MKIELFGKTLELRFGKTQHTSSELPSSVFPRQKKITPARVANIIRQASDGNIGELQDLYTEMEFYDPKILGLFFCQTKNPRWQKGRVLFLPRKGRTPEAGPRQGFWGTSPAKNGEISPALIFKFWAKTQNGKRPREGGEFKKNPLSRWGRGLAGLRKDEPFPGKNPHGAKFPALKKPFFGKKLGPFPPSKGQVPPETAIGGIQNALKSGVQSTPETQLGGAFINPVRDDSPRFSPISAENPGILFFRLKPGGRDLKAGTGGNTRWGPGKTNKNGGIFKGRGKRG